LFLQSNAADVDYYLLRRVRAFPPGSQLLMSAINIPTMVDLIRFHKLVPVPVDIDPTTLAPRLDLMEK
jgi:dTDP-4-amino-4,6-dideoxygalactose transaminase